MLTTQTIKINLDDIKVSTEQIERMTYLRCLRYVNDLDTSKYIIGGINYYSIFKIMIIKEFLQEYKDEIKFRNYISSIYNIIDNIISTSISNNYNSKVYADSLMKLPDGTISIYKKKVVSNDLLIFFLDELNKLYPNNKLEYDDIPNDFIICSLFFKKYKQDKKSFFEEIYKRLVDNDN
jgi:hypothetical protein